MADEAAVAAAAAREASTAISLPQGLSSRYEESPFSFMRFQPWRSLSFNDGHLKVVLTNACIVNAHRYKPAT